MIFELAQDFHDAVAAMPQEHPKHRMLELLEEAVRRDIHFVDRHPTTLFQCMWNTCWWYDCPEAAKHYEEPEGGWEEPPPWEGRAPKVYELMAHWHAERDGARAGAAWLRSRRPPAMSLASGLRAVLRGHGGPVLCVAFSPDGTRIASGSGGTYWEKDYTIRVWDTESGQEIAVLRGHGNDVNCVAFSPDGMRIASGSSDKTVRIWDATSGEQDAVLCGHTGSVKSVAFSPDGQRIASVGDLLDNAVRIWDATPGAEPIILREDSSWPVGTDFRLTGLRVLIHSRRKTVLWDAQSDQEIAALQGGDLRVDNVAFSHDGSRTAAGNIFDSIARIWDVETGEEVAVLRGHDSCVNSLAFSPDGTRIATGSGRPDYEQDHTVRLWDTRSGECHAVLRGHNACVNNVAFSPNGTLVASGSHDNTVLLWDADVCAGSVALREHEWLIHSVVFSPDGLRIASGSSDNTVRIWDANSGEQDAVLYGHTGLVTSVAFSPDGERIVSGSGNIDKTVRVWDWASGAEIAALRHKDEVNSVAFSPDGRRIACGTFGGGRVLDVESGTETAVLSASDRGIFRLAFSPNGSVIVGYDSRGILRFWDAGSGKQLRFLNAPASVSSVAFSSDNARIVIELHEHIEILDGETGECLEVIKGTGDVSAIAAGSETYPFRALVQDRETVVEDARDSKTIARFPAPLAPITTHPAGYTWAGGTANHLYILTLERDPEGGT